MRTTEMLASPSFLTGIFVTSVICWLLRETFNRSKLLPLPPGPSPLPIIGNLHQAPQINPWRTYYEWTKQYGPIYKLQYGLSTIIMLGTVKSAYDLLQKRGQQYADRPKLPMADGCLSQGLRIGLMSYSDRYRMHQRMVATYLNPGMSVTYQPVQDLESRQLMHELLSTDDFSPRFHRFAASVIFALAFGKRMERGDEPGLRDIGLVAEHFLQAARVGLWIVDSFPILNHLPPFLAPWKRTAQRWKKFEVNLFLSNLAKGRASHSWNWTKHVQDIEKSGGLSDLDMAYNFGSMYEAGSDTTAMALDLCTMAALVHSHCQRAAQHELDSAVGTTTFPMFHHRDSLPYVTAFINECLRWRPITAGGFAHAVTRSDTYAGYRIPRGAVVIGNHWAISRDETVFSDPETFLPERWLENPRLPQHGFGFGRRVCSGQHIAKASLFINVARILWAFDVVHKVDEKTGQEIEVDPWAMTTHGFNSKPEPFECVFRLRDEGRKEAIEKAWEEREDVDVLLERMAPR